ncbi:MAG: hypothetical protein Q9219_005510 [cf. Caloplaca sp. 3 TL-2023]
MEESFDEEEDEDSVELPELSEIVDLPSPPRKRPRINPSSSRLSKPFQSPFKTPLKSTSQSIQNETRSWFASTSGSASAHKSTSDLTTPTNTPNRKPLARWGASKHSPVTPAPYPSSRLSQLQKKHTALLNELSALRRNLDITNQAAEIEASTTDAELETLIRKWRDVSRDAAEEVLKITKERIEGMGGVKAWRKKEKETKGGWAWREEGQGHNERLDAPGEPPGLSEHGTTTGFEESGSVVDATAEDEDDDVQSRW